MITTKRTALQWAAEIIMNRGKINNDEEDAVPISDIVKQIQNHALEEAASLFDGDDDFVSGSSFASKIRSLKNMS